MTRRGFLACAGLGAAGFALDPERLLWRPGAKTIFLPPAPTLAFAPDAWTRAMAPLAVGDIFTIQRVYNRLNSQRADTIRLREYVVTAVHEFPDEAAITGVNV